MYQQGKGLRKSFKQNVSGSDFQRFEFLNYHFMTNTLRLLGAGC